MQKNPRFGNRNWRKNSPLLVAAILAVHPLCSFADPDTEMGAAGTNGANGTGTVVGLQYVVTPGQPGTAGGYTPASDTTDADNFATDTGGLGGNGGNGAISGPLVSPGGNGGGGGFANSTASQTVFVAGTALGIANSTGGGGNGGNGGGNKFTARGAGGNGANGGDAEANATSLADQAGGGVLSEASGTAIGGNGGNGGTGANAGGVGGNGGVGGIGFLGTIEAQTIGPNNVAASATVVGGNGGTGTDGGSGGNGPDESLDNKVSADTESSARPWCSR